MTHDELKLVLEALEKCRTYHQQDWSSEETTKPEVKQAITALEEALAQPEQCNYPDCKCPTENPCLKGLAQPEQKPKRTGMVYYKNDACQAKDAYSHDCICWTKAQPEQEPVAWLLTDKNINSLQVDSIQRLIDRLKHAHHTDIRVRINGHDEWFEADWLKHMVRVTPPQPEQNPMSDEMLQAITDPENQPSQYGTVTLDYHFEKIKKWEDLFERMSNKVLQQLEQEPFAYVNVEKRRLEFASPYVKWDTPTTIKLDKIPLYTTPPQSTWVGSGDLEDSNAYLTPPQRKPLTHEEIWNAIRPLTKSDEVCKALIDVSMNEYRAIEAAHNIKENT